LKARQLQNIETLTFLLITIIGVIQGDVTVFYIIYLFWFQELIRTIINRIMTNKNDDRNKATSLAYGSFFLLFIYLIFIVVLFGFILNWDNVHLMAINIRTLFFRNLYFNINILVFAAQYYLYRRNPDSDTIDQNLPGMSLFNRNHIILHISIIFGGLLQMAVVKRYPEYFSGDVLWGSALVISPFLLLKILIDRKKNPVPVQAG
jgi:hypothetical protein